MVLATKVGFGVTKLNYYGHLKFQFPLRKIFIFIGFRHASNMIIFYRRNLEKIQKKL